MEKKIVFISHISEEREIAQSLKELIQKSFLGIVDVFVSSDPESIDLGQEWLNRIKFSLGNCVVEFVIASPVSIRRAWVNFEAGAGWIREIPVIPLCHSGMTPGKLPAPLNALQAALATDENQLARIPRTIAKAVGMEPPEVNFQPFIETVLSYEETTEASIEITEEVAIPGPNGLTNHELNVLLVIAQEGYANDGDATVAFLYDKLKSLYASSLPVSLGLKMLERKRLVESRTIEGWGNEPYTVCRVTDEGWLWMERNRDSLSHLFREKQDDIPF